ncbi:MAG: hypothetical protein HYV02_08750 [Deltaproteobacteria bacterium]|nr:hypothetical protein [Deltaproteobacteria bacterium]
MLTSPNFKELLNLFKKHRCEYLIVGGYAVMKYSEPRFTKDLDIVVATHSKNASAVFSALKDFGAPLKNLSEDDFAKEGYFYKMGNPPMRVDILMSIPGITFNEAWQRRVTEDIEGVEMHFISKPDLIAAKRAAGRAQDLIDAALLEKNG